jgi:sugar phosphate isomerase/epimerase
MSNPPVFVSTTAFTPNDLDHVLATCERHRIDALELSTMSRYDLALLGSTAYPSRYLVHNYFPAPATPFVLNLASQNPETLSRSREHCRAAIDLSARLGGSVYAAHAGYLADIPVAVLGRPDAQSQLSESGFSDYGRAYATLVESAAELAAYGRARNVRFLIENHVLAAGAGSAGRRLLSMVAADELVALASAVDDPGFGVLVDVGHVNVSASTLGFDRHAFIDAVAPHVAALHLSDNDGVVDSNDPFDGDAWFLPRLRDFPEAAVTVELAPVGIERMLAVRDVVSTWR